MKSILFSILLMATTDVQAASLSTSTVELLRATSNNEQLKSPERRQSLAAKVKAYCEEIEDVYPRNSPAEEQWLDNEIKSGGDRVSRVLSSPEFGRRQAKLFTDGCMQWSLALEEHSDRSRYYVGLAYVFLKFSTDAEFLAKKNALNPENFGLSYIPRSVAEALLLAALLSEK